ncbi:hypothetical protein H4S14_002162 [Agrobacterium vitis]|nr:hypothetical protein [Agrobacterium vitis]MBE1438415.1 hypothetical protein [Agrobacterium vitis]
MKKFLVAGLIALGCITATAAPSMAQSSMVVISDRGHYPDRFERHHDRRFYRHERVRHYRDHCRTKTIKYRHHGRLIVEKRTVCR